MAALQMVSPMNRDIVAKSPMPKRGRASGGRPMAPEGKRTLADKGKRERLKGYSKKMA